MNKAFCIADSAGVAGAIYAALCCAGAPFIVAGVAALGLSFIRKDAILIPLMSVSLLVALWGFWKGRDVHRSSGPLVLAIIGAVALVSGVVYVHGVPAKALIGVGGVLLVAAIAWSVRARSVCAT